MDETEGTQDAKTSEDTKGTSEQTTKTFTEETQAKAVSDALAKAGRTAKELTQLGESTKADRKQLTDDRVQWRKEKDEEKLESIRDDPDALKDWTKSKALRDEKAELDRRERELKVSEEKHAEALKGVVESTKERNAREIATRLNVDSEPLMKFTDGSTEAMEDLAKSLPKKGETKTLTPDSGKTIGGETIPGSAKGKMRAGWDELHK